MLNTEQKIFFEENGYLVLRNVLTNQTSALQKIVQDILSGSRKMNHYVRYGKGGVPIFFRIPQLAKAFPEFQKVSSHDGIGSAVRDLLGPFEVFRDVVVAKPPKAGMPVVYHQDSVYFDLPNPQAVLSAWIPMEDVPVTSGCLKVIPGSHRQIQPHRIRLGRYVLPQWLARSLRGTASLTGTGENPKNFLQKFFMTLKNRLLGFASKCFPAIGDLNWLESELDPEQRAKEVMLPIQKGDVIFFHGQLLHASAPNVSLENRVAYIVTYKAIGNA